MKLCRFELTADPGVARSGLYYEGRFYETDGQNATAVHESDAAVLLPPFSTAPSIRVYESIAAGQNEGISGYRFLNPTRIAGSGGAFRIQEEDLYFDLSVRVAAVISTRGAYITPEDAADFFLGYTLLVSLRAPEIIADAERSGLPLGAAEDIAHFVGPVITTPDELEELQTGMQTRYRFPFRLKVAGEIIADSHETQGPFIDSLVIASRFGPLVPGELIAGPAFPIPDLSASALGRGLQPGDTVEFEVNRLGRILFHIE